MRDYSVSRNVVRLMRRNFRSSLDREFLVIQLVLPLFFIFVAGFGYTLIVPRVEGISYETFLATGAVAMTVMSSSMLSGTMIWFDRNFGMFEQILMGPFTRLQYVLSVALTIVLTGLMSSVVVDPGLARIDAELSFYPRIIRFFDPGLVVFRGIWHLCFSSGQIQRSTGSNDESDVFRLYIS